MDANYTLPPIHKARVKNLRNFRCLFQSRPTWSDFSIWPLFTAFCNRLFFSPDATSFFIKGATAVNKLYFGGDIQHQNIFDPSANKEDDFGTDEGEVYLVLAICLNVVCEQLSEVLQLRKKISITIMYIIHMQILLLMFVTKTLFGTGYPICKEIAQEEKFQFINLMVPGCF